MVEVEVSWTDESTGELGFRIYRSTATTPSFPGDYTQLDTVGENVTSYIDTNPPVGEEVYYAVTAYNGAGDSDPVTGSKVITLGISIDGNDVVEITIDGEVVDSLSIDGTDVF